MSGFGVIENEWRKVSNCADSLETVQAKYRRLIDLMVKVAKEYATYVPGLSLVFDEKANTAELRSFAGVSSIRLGWDATGIDLAGVMIFSSMKSGANEPTVILKVYMPTYSSSARLPLEDGSEVTMDSFHPSNFAFTVLMNAIRKQVDLSSQ
ncbi:hypothetical protein [Comamonas kerstersii]|uniref:Uncharacterized protein n=1 Tax=Comamonas kerstersii TaxID=225992 RepID=A0A6A1R1C5_9BURK|nr:hypothetical protein [Comamonas kerstersii]KAB0586171.1 hypothetical protein F7P80_11085 [Comamonas kerstersii]